MKVAKTFFQLVSLVMAALSLAALAAPLIKLAGAHAIFGATPEPVADLINWHHQLYWHAARNLGLLTTYNFGSTQDQVVYVVIHGTNVLLGVLSLRAIWRAPVEPGTVAIGPIIDYVLPHVQQAALWMLQALTAGVLGNYVYDILIKGGP